MRSFVAFLVLTAAVLPCLEGVAHAEYAVGMEPGRVAVRHAAWDAAAACRPAFPAELGRTVDLSITIDRRGRVLSVEGTPDVRVFEQCVLRALRGAPHRPTGVDRASRRWVVVTRYVFEAVTASRPEIVEHGRSAPPEVAAPSPSDLGSERAQLRDLRGIERTIEEKDVVELHPTHAPGESCADE
ncbi:MAG: hypothetical protein J0L92_11660 [Deltaproteobacteria bacterium]|nr:hypothetical protein [Deltaproteobacteria bacterium]